MVLEVAPLQIRNGREADFEAAFATAQTIIASMPGYQEWKALLHPFYAPFPTVSDYVEIASLGSGDTAG